MAASIFTELPRYMFHGVERAFDGLRKGLRAEYPVEEDPPPITPFDVVAESGKASVRFYRAKGEARRLPLLFVPPLIKRPWVYDLMPGRSLVELLTAMGFNLYLIDWIPPNADDTWRGFDAYCNQDVAHAVRAAKAHSGNPEVSLVGYCFGALLSVIYVAQHPRAIRNLITLTLPLDNSVHELPSSGLFDNLNPEIVDLVSSIYGNCPAWLVNAGFKSMAPVHHAFDKYVGLYRNRERDGYPEMFDLFERFMDSDVPLAGQIFRELTLDVSRKNSLLKGEFICGGRPVDLRQITCPVLNVIGEHDDVVHPKSSQPFPLVIGSTDKRNLTFPTGHIGVVVSSSALEKLWPQIGDWLVEHEQ